MDTIDILVVEDNPGDRRLIKQAFEDRDLPGTLHFVRNGEDALDWLFRRGEFVDTPPPNLVLLDLNLPAVSGHTVLERLKNEEGLQQIPVVVFTGSRSAEDISKLYRDGVSAYLVKPTDPNDFAEVIERFVKFWVISAELPPVDG